MSKATSPPPASSQSALERMRRQRQTDTSPELALRKAIWQMGLRYRVHVSPLGGRRKADVVFSREKVAVFLDGCYWHGCPVHGTLPKANREWWTHKIEANRRRDQDTNRALRAAGWEVLRVWEHDEPEEVARTVARIVQARRAQR